jgi:hypothetical protein
MAASRFVKRLAAATCRLRAEEARLMALEVAEGYEWTILERIAEMWLALAREIEKKRGAI